MGADGDCDDGLGGAEGGGVRLQRAGGGPAAAAGVAEIQVLHRRPLHRGERARDLASRRQISPRGGPAPVGSPVGGGI